MNRGNVALIVVIVVVVGFLVYLSSLSSNDSDMYKWQFRYQYDGEKLAYDRDFFIDYIKKDVGASNFNKLEERLSRSKNLQDNSLYLFYNRNFDIDKTETEALYQFVMEGNDALIIAEDFNYEFFKQLRGIQLVKEYGYLILSRYDSALTIVDTVSIQGKTRTPISIITYGVNALSSSFVVDTVHLDQDIYNQSKGYNWEEEDYADPEYDEYTYEEEEYDYEEEAFSYDEEDFSYEEEVLDETVISKPQVEYPTPSIEVLGKAKKLGPNVLKIKFGKGHIYLHSNPVLFTNVQFDKPEVFTYVQEMSKDLSYDHVYWDELSFQFLNAQNEGSGITDKSYFEYIFKNRALKTALFFFLIGLLVFLVVGIKRKYNAIEIVDPLTNSSIDFSKTIARLYWLNPNHRKMADQKMKMFLFEVRNRYGLTTHVLDEDFKIRFRAKSGVSEKLINRLFDAYNLARQSPSIHHDVLIQISESIVKIRQTWK